MRTRFALVLIALCLSPIAGLAVPTGLNMMPTAESLSLGQARFQFESEGSGKLYVPNDSTLIGSQGGVILGIEAGIDNVSDKGTVYNTKWVFKGDGLLFPALAIGAQNLTSGERPQYYAVTTKSLLSIAKVHAGFMRDEEHDDNVTMLGASAVFGPLVVKADRLQGSFREGDAVSVGWTVKGITLTGTQYNFENQPDKRTFSVSYEYGGPF